MKMIVAGRHRHHSVETGANRYHPRGMREGLIG